MKKFICIFLFFATAATSLSAQNFFQKLGQVWDVATGKEATVFDNEGHNLFRSSGTESVEFVFQDGTKRTLLFEKYEGADTGNPMLYQRGEGLRFTLDSGERVYLGEQHKAFSKGGLTFRFANGSGYSWNEGLEVWQPNGRTYYGVTIHPEGNSHQVVTQYVHKIAPIEGDQ